MGNVRSSPFVRNCRRLPGATNRLDRGSTISAFCWPSCMNSSPDRFGSEVARLLSEPLHPVYRQTVEIMARRKGDKVFGTIADRVPVYISDDVDDPDLVFRYLCIWSQTCDLDILTVTRVDVIAKRPGMDFLRKYNILFDGIVLVWPNGTPNPSGKWLRKMGVEATFYHEVGHHAYQHTEGGQVLIQEEEAKAYEHAMFINARPVLFWILNIMIGPFYRLARRFRYRKQGWILLMRGGSGPLCHPARRTRCCLGRDAVPGRALDCSAPCQFRHIFG